MGIARHAPTHARRSALGRRRKGKKRKKDKAKGETGKHTKIRCRGCGDDGGGRTHTREGARKERRGWGWGRRSSLCGFETGAVVTFTGGENAQRQRRRHRREKGEGGGMKAFTRRDQGGGGGCGVAGGTCMRRQGTAKKGEQPKRQTKNHTKSRTQE